MSHVPTPPLDRRRAVVSVAVAVAVAVVVNLALLGAGHLAGASFLVPDRSTEGALMPVGPVPVVLSTLLPLAAALVLTSLICARWPRALPALQALAVLVTLASLAMPLTTDTDAGTRVVLAAMHLVVGAAYLAATRPAGTAVRAARRPDLERAQ
jgi:hypothetical protein